MQLPKDLLSGSYRAPNVFLCQTDKEKIGQLNVSGLEGTFKWNSYSDISFEIGRTYTDLVTGENKVNPYYDLVQGLRMIYLEGFGYFQIQDPEIEGDGIQEIKSVNAYSGEYELSQKYLDTFIINQGTTGSIDGVILYDATDPSRSLLNLVLDEKIPNWSIGHVDSDLATQQRSFDVDRSTIYDFLMNDLCETFKCVIIFNTLDNTVNVYDEETAGFETDVMITFDNLAQSISLDYSTDDIKTVLYVTGADDIDVREVNFGMASITDLSFYHSVEWMGQDLYDAYSKYLEKVEGYRTQYEKTLANLNQYQQRKLELVNRVSTYLTDVHLTDFMNFLVDLYQNNGTPTLEDMNSLTGEFEFVDRSKWSAFESAMLGSGSLDSKDNAVFTILAEIWEEFGLSLLEGRVEAYKNVQVVQTDAGMSSTDSDEYYMYHANYMMLTSAERAQDKRSKEVEAVEALINSTSGSINVIAEDLALDKNLTKEQRIRLSPFLREDEYSDDGFVITEIDTEEERSQTLRSLLEAARKELRKLSEPQLSFDTKIANILALPEFEPIQSQFALGNMIKVALRPDYIKKSRLMEMSIDFEDFSDLTVKFGDALSVRSQADIHADLLSQAASAGKSVASNSSKWQKGANTANAIQLKINQGLLDAATQIKSIDGNQNVSMDKYGIHLQKLNENGEVDLKQGWITNNQFLFSDDGFKTSKSVFGEFSYDADGDGESESHWGILADALVGGYIEGSKISGGTINIGNGTFVVDRDGRVQINAFGGALSDRMDEIADAAYAYSVKLESTGSLLLQSKEQETVITCHVYVCNTKVTESLPVGTKFKWIRISNDSVADATWNANHIYEKASATGTEIASGNCNQIIVTTDDIANAAQFLCEVEI
ncbi:MAG TPA: hypothetical protein DCW90_02070 [Lachnospiraceae bacterium]|nr:hypothetical protein [Lachnospiraceae bacterium]